MYIARQRGGRAVEYVLLVINTDWDLVRLGRLYRERADSENPGDELKRQWGWGGL